MQQLASVSSNVARRGYSVEACGLKDRMAELIPEWQKEVKEFRGAHGSDVIGEVTVDMVRAVHVMRAPRALARLRRASLRQPRVSLALVGTSSCVRNTPLRAARGRKPSLPRFFSLVLEP